jgi:gamma-glutamylcyclotransferase (GGCT)/AIG2-like uncharacterized protein YtfP
LQPKTMPQSIFVYGTLKQNQLRGKAWPRPPLSMRPALVRATLWDLGAFPGITLGDDWILGELWTLSDHDMHATLKVLDAIEDYDAKHHRGLYLRVAIESFPTPAELGDAKPGVEHPFRTDVANWPALRAFTYLANDPDMLRSARRIAPNQPWNGQIVASWPDTGSRVPQTLEEESSP